VGTPNSAYITFQTISRLLWNIFGLGAGLPF
jgi:hypothetical protein